MALVSVIQSIDQSSQNKWVSRLFMTMMKKAFKCRKEQPSSTLGVGTRAVKTAK